MAKYEIREDFPLPIHIADLSERVVTHQQLNDPAFYALVKAELVTGKVDVIDQRHDEVEVDGGARLGFDNPQAAVELAKSQMRWIGNAPSSPAEIFDTLGLDWFDLQLKGLKFEQQTRQLNSLDKTD